VPVQSLAIKPPQGNIFGGRVRACTHHGHASFGSICNIWKSPCMILVKPTRVAWLQNSSRRRLRFPSHSAKALMAGLIASIILAFECLPRRRLRQWTHKFDHPVGSGERRLSARLYSYYGIHTSTFRSFQIFTTSAPTVGTSMSI